MTSVVRVFDAVPRKALVARSSAAPVVRQLQSVAVGEIDELLIDFDGIEAVSPAFVDEVMSGLARTVLTRLRPRACVTFAHVPTRLSRKFEAVAGSYSATIRTVNESTWEIRNLERKLA